MTQLSLEVGTVHEGLDVVRNSDSKLIMLVGDHSPALKATSIDLAAAHSWRTVDLNTSLAQTLLALSAIERRAQAWELLEDAVGDRSGPVAIISTDVLFEPTLGVRPYEALRRLGRRGQMLAAWFGRVQDQDLLRAQPGHPEYVRVKLDVPYIRVPTGKGVGD